MIANSGSQRFDVYAGDFTKNDEYIVSPFLDAFLYIPDVPWKYAKQIGGALNGDYVAQGSSKRSDEAGEEERQRAQLERREQERAMYAKGEVQHLFNAWMRTQNEAAKEDLRTLDMRAQEQKTLGYVTKDSCPGVGDDTQVSLTT